MNFRNYFFIIIGLAIFWPTPSLAFEYCSLVDRQETSPGIYISSSCDGKNCIESIPARGTFEVSKKSHTIVYVSGKTSANQSPVVFQLKHKGISRPGIEDGDERVVKLHRDRVDFLCDGESDTAAAVFDERSLDIPEEEYDRYHRFFYVNSDQIGRQLYQIFHINYFKDGNRQCVRTDRVSRRFLFLLKDRLQNYGRWAGLLNRLPLGPKRAFAQSKESEANHVVLKNYVKPANEVGCVELDVTLQGSRLDISVDNLEDNIILETATKSGFFMTRKLILKD